MFKKAWYVVAVVLMVTGLMTGTALAQSSGDAARGQQLWEQSGCKNCHGASGEGINAAPLAGSSKSVDEWVAQVRTPRANMPTFSAAQVSDADIADMNAYLKTLSAPTSFAPKFFPVPAGAAEGLTLMSQKRCTSCHGDGQQFVQMMFVANNRTPDAATVIKQLRSPFKAMPSFSATQVTDEQAGKIAEYLASLAAAPAAAPATLPKSGGDNPFMPLSLALLLGGAAMLGLGLAARVMKKA